MSNLPVPAGGFVGREQELAAARRLLSRSRLLTLVGPPGVGKSRLALQVAHQSRMRFPDDVWWVDLAALHDGALVAQAVASEVVSDRTGRPPMDVLADFLQDKRLLLVLDNCEHVLDDTAVLVDALLRVAARVRIVATSRQVLGVYGEASFTVPPLAVPPAEISADVPLASAVAGYDSVRLFASRAAAVVPGFAVDEGNAAAVAGLCQRLEGIPLAIELAAVRLDRLSVRDVLSRLDERFTVLGEAEQTRLPSRRFTHHQTLWATVDWSYQLCAVSEQAMWSRLSVFAGEFCLDDAEVVCSGDGIEQEDVFDLVAALMDKSILTMTEHSGTAWYRMLETIRAYGRDQLAQRGEETVLRDRHRDHYERMAAQSDAEWLSPNQVEWLTRLEHEGANLRAALDYSLAAHDRVPAVVDSVVHLRYHWITRGTPGEGRHWLGRVLTMWREPSAVRAKALWADSHLALLQRDRTAARPQLRECAELARQLGDQAALTYATQFAGLAALVEGDFTRAIVLIRRVLRHHQRHPNDLWLALFHLSLACCQLGDGPQALRFGEECLALSEGSGAPVATSYALWAVGLAKWQEGNAEDAGALVRRSLREKPSWHDTWGTAHCLEVLAWVEAATGRSERAARLLGAAHALWQHSGTTPSRLAYLASSDAVCATRSRRDLGDAAFITAFTTGVRLDLDSAVAEALTDPYGVNGVAHA